MNKRKSHKDVHDLLDNQDSPSTWKEILGTFIILIIIFGFLYVGLNLQ
jgi:hypothetical protein